MNREKLTEKVEKFEMTNGDDGKLCRMLGDLRKIDAPPAFDFAVKKRIAERRTATPKLKLLTILRFAAPLAVIFALAGFVVFNLSFSSDLADVPQVAEKSPAPIKNQPTENAVAVQYPPEFIADNAKTVINPTSRTAVKTSKPIFSNRKPAVVKKLVAKTPKNDGDEFGGTIESASTGTERIIQPRGLNPNENTPKPDVSVNNQPIPANEMLLHIGIETDVNYQVKLIQKNSLAEHSDIKTGDIIEAVDETKLAPETVFNKLLTVKKLHLIRSGKKIAAELGKR